MKLKRINGEKDWYGAKEFEIISDHASYRLTIDPNTTWEHACIYSKDMKWQASLAGNKFVIKIDDKRVIDPADKTLPDFLQMLDAVNRNIRMFCVTCPMNIHEDITLDDINDIVPFKQEMVAKFFEFCTKIKELFDKWPAQMELNFHFGGQNCGQFVMQGVDFRRRCTSQENKKPWFSCGSLYFGKYSSIDVDCINPLNTCFEDWNGNMMFKDWDEFIQSKSARIAIAVLYPRMDAIVAELERRLS